MKLYEEATAFIAEARRNSWAGGEHEVEPLHPGSKRHVFERKSGGLRYEDEFWGSQQFQGMEVVYGGDNALWVMSYRGLVSWEHAPFIDVSPGDIYRFLKAALIAKADEARLGISSKPIRFEEGMLSYEDTPDVPGHLGSVMSGTENIVLGRLVVVFQGKYLGGFVKV